MLIEILLVLQGSSAVVERAFSTLRRILRENRRAMSKERLNQLLTVKINLPVLQSYQWLRCYFKRMYSKILSKEKMEMVRS